MFTQPSSYRDVVLAPDVAHQIEDLVSGRISFPSEKMGILLHGPSGTGKSTLARLLPAAIDANRGGQVEPLPTLERVRSGSNSVALLNTLENIATTMPPIGCALQYIILEEIDNLGAVAMSSMKNVMDAGRTSAFIMTTNFLHKIDTAVKSRSHVISICAAPPRLWASKGIAALTAAGVKTIPAQEELETLVGACKGDTRQIIDQLEKLKNDLP